MRHTRWLIALIPLIVLGCGGSGGGSGVPTTPGGTSGDPGGPPPTSRTELVAAVMDELTTREQRKHFFGEYTDAVQATTNQEIVDALNIVESTWKQHLPSGASRHTDNAPTGPEPAQGLVIPPIEVPSRDSGPFKVSGNVAFSITHENETVGYVAKVVITVKGEILTVPVNATIRIEGSGASEYSPNVSGKFAGNGSMMVSFDATAELLGHQAISTRSQADKTFVGTVNDMAELAGVDSKTTFSDSSTFLGTSTEATWDSTTIGARPGIGGMTAKPGTTTANPPTNLPPAEAAEKVKGGAHLAAMLAFPEELLLKHVREVWQGGHCVVVEHINPDHEEALKPGDKIEVDLRVMHREDHSTVSPVHYQPSLDAKYVKEVGPAHFEITVPETVQKAQQLMSTVTFVASTNRGRAQIRHHYSISSLRLDSVSIDESTGTLTLTGNFGSAGEGTVTIGGVKVQVLSWYESQIKCKIPVSGAGSAGSVVVKTGDAAQGTEQVSNSVPLTSWRGEITYTFAAAGTLKQVVTWDLHLRAGLKGLLPARLDPAGDSSAHYQASGTYKVTSEKTNHTITWSGSGNVAVPQAPQPGGSFATFMGMLDPSKKTLSFVLGASIPTGLTMVHMSETPPDPPQTETHAGLLFDTGYLSELQNEMGAIETPLSGYDIAGGSKSTSVVYPIILGSEMGTVTVTVSPMVAEFAP